MNSEFFMRSSCKVARWSAIPLVSFIAAVMLTVPLRAGALDGTTNGATDGTINGPFEGTNNGTIYGPQPARQSGDWWLPTSGGVVTLTASYTLTGPTTINQGQKLVVDGWLSDSAVGINSGTLGGTGHLDSVTVNAGGHLAPGDLNTGALVIAGGVDRWKPNGLVGYAVWNEADRSVGKISANTENTITAALKGGKRNHWNAGDAFKGQRQGKAFTTGRDEGQAGRQVGHDEAEQRLSIRDTDPVSGRLRQPAQA